MLSLNGNFTTLADFGLAVAAKPVVARTRDLMRKRNARKVAAVLREHDRKVAKAQEQIEARIRERSNLSVVFSNGRVVRPIK